MADLHLGPGRVWAAPVGTELDEPGWTEIGTTDDGLVIIDDIVRDQPPISLLAANSRAFTLTLTCLSTPLGWWRAHRELLGETHPRARRAKREYRRRRR